MKKGLQTKFSTRQYMLSKDFEIYYYSDRELKKVDSHTHDYYEFYFFLEGDVGIEIEAQEYPLRYGDIVLIPPGLRHHSVIHAGQQSRPAYRRFVLWISQEYCSQLMELSSSYGYLMQYVLVNRDYILHNDTVTFNMIQSRVFQLIEEVHADRFGREAQVCLYMNELLLLINRVAYEQKHPVSVHEETALYQNLLLYIEAHLEEDLSLERLAQTFYVSRYHVAHTFTDHIGISIHQYITRKRLEASRAAILAGEKISDTYLRYGFRDYSSFFRAFRKEYGISPKEFRMFSESASDKSAPDTMAQSKRQLRPQE